MCMRVRVVARLGPSTPDVCHIGGDLDSVDGGTGSSHRPGGEDEGTQMG